MPLLFNVFIIWINLFLKYKKWILTLCNTKPKSIHWHFFKGTHLFPRRTFFLGHIQPGLFGRGHGFGGLGFTHVGWHPLADWEYFKPFGHFPAETWIKVWFVNNFVSNYV